MIVNVSYALLDAPVIAGRGEALVLPGMTHARLLEEVAAIGGGLRHLGVEQGRKVPIDLEEDTDAIVAALAVARIGGVVAREPAGATPVVVVCPASALRPDPGGIRLVRGGPGNPSGTDPDLDWDVLVRAGRTDPAACEVLDKGSAYSPVRSVAEQIEVLVALRAPYDPGQLRRLLQV